jgi:AbrB family looped-hinge helix DNA binding protein
MERKVGDFMGRAKVSARYQLGIPKDIREQGDVRPGQEFEVITKGGIISFVPVRSIASMRGFVKGMRTTGFREKKDRV